MEESNRKSKYVTPPGFSDWFTDSDGDPDDPVPLWVITQRKKLALESRDVLMYEARVIEKLRADDRRTKKKTRLEKRKIAKSKFSSRVKCKVASDVAKTMSAPPRVSSTPTKTRPTLKKPESPTVVTTPKNNKTSLSLETERTDTASISSFPSSIVTSSRTLATISPHSYTNQPDLPQSMLNSPFELRNHKCTGCSFMYDECRERNFKKICLNAVFDYIVSVGITNITDLGTRKAYHQAYIWQVRCYLMNKTGLYETNDMLNIPKCMIMGSLNDALMMRNGGNVVNACEQMRKHNIEECMRVKVCREMFKDCLEER